jgi:Tol biopolymer transport system component
MTYTRVTSATDINRDSWHPHLSPDGTIVVFSSDSDFLDEGRTDNVFEIWLYDTVAMTYTRVTSATDMGRDSYDASFNGDASLLAFRSDADFLDEGRPDNVTEIWLYDTVGMTYTRVTSATGVGRNSSEPSLNASGTVIAFDSDCDFLDEGILDNQFEVWLHWWEYRVYLPLVVRQPD